MQPLKGIKIVDFSAQLPGPLASLILAEAGAEVIRIEPPGKGDMLRQYPPMSGDESLNFALLNRGKRCIAIDLKQQGAAERLFPLIAEADIVLEQFRPGVMERLGVGYERLKEIKPDLIYCSITGYGQNGPKARIAGHDLNYCADTGLLAMSGDASGAPFVPAALVADIAGGAYPAVMNVMFALMHRDRTGEGARLDIAMSENLFTFMYWAAGRGFATGAWPEPSGDILTGGSPRYSIYRTSDGRHLAVAALEEKFWQTFCDLIGLPEALRADAGREATTRNAVAAIISQATAAHWHGRLSDHDTCCNIVATLEEAVNDPHYRERSVFKHELTLKSGRVPATPVPVSPVFRSGPEKDVGYPQLGADNLRYLGEEAS